MTKNESKTLIPVEPITAEDLYLQEGAVEQVVARVNAVARELYSDDVSTDKARKAIASNARKVASTKTALDKLGQDFVRPIKEKIKVVDDGRRAIRDQLDELKGHMREPLDRWEQAKAQAEQAVRYYETIPENLELLPAEAIEKRFEALMAEEPINNQFGEWSDDVHKAWEYHCLKHREALHNAKVREKREAEERAAREKERKELEELRKFKAEKEAEFEAELERVAREPDAQLEAESRRVEAIRTAIARSLDQCFPYPDSMESWDNYRRRLIKVFSEALMEGRIQHVRLVDSSHG